MPHPRSPASILPALITALVLGVTYPAATAAQTPGDPIADSRPSECFGLTFGRWVPPLQWYAAGHVVDSLGPEYEGGAPRESAAAPDAASDSSMLLFPSWWRAGVIVSLARSLSGSDTVDGVATALNATGQANPSARVRAWRVPCGPNSER